MAACEFLHVLRLGDGTPGMSPPPFIRVFLNNQQEQPFHLQPVGGALGFVLFDLVAPSPGLLGRVSAFQQVCPN